MGNEVSARTKRFPLRRKKSPSGKEQLKGKKATSLGSLGFGHRKSSSLRPNLNAPSPNISRKGEPVAQKSSEDVKDRKFSIEDQIVENSLKTKVGLQDFTLVKTVGKGSFGRVFQVKKKDTGKIYAMKVLDKEQVIKRKQYEHTMAERRILEDIDHPFIVSLRFAFQTTQKLFMVFDFFNGGELFYYLSKTGRFGEDRARLYAAEILLGLEHVHSLHIIYRDLKPENLLLDSDGHIRLTDFGLSKENVVDDSVKSFCGTPEYLAPEVLRRQKYGKAVDWWSLGTLLYEMITGLPPFYDRNRDKMYKKVLGADLKFPSYMLPESRSICRGLLQRDPVQRLGYRGATEIKSHPFFSQHLDFNDVYYKKIKPKFVPTVSGIEDTRNVDKTFTSIPACVTPTPRDSKLVDKEFTDFTFTQANVFDSSGERNFNQNDDFGDFDTNGFGNFGSNNLQTMDTHFANMNLGSNGLPLASTSGTNGLSMKSAKNPPQDPSANTAISGQFQQKPVPKPNFGTSLTANGLQPTDIPSGGNSNPV